MTEEAPTKKKQSFFWPDIEDAESAREAIKAGVFGGCAMIATLIIPMLLMVFTGEPLIWDPPSTFTFYIYQGGQLVFAAFLTWRIWTGRGRFASVILFSWIVLEVLVKLVMGQLNVGYSFMWAVILIAVFHSIRASWFLYRQRKAGLTAPNASA